MIFDEGAVVIESIVVYSLPDKDESSSKAGRHGHKHMNCTHSVVYKRTVSTHDQSLYVGSGTAHPCSKHA